MRLFFYFMMCFSVLSYLEADLSLAEAPQQAPSQILEPASNPIQTHNHDSLYHIPQDGQLDNAPFLWQLVNILVTLGVIIIVILIASKLLKKLFSARIQQMNSTSPIKILETRSISPKSLVYLLEINGKEIAIAESHSGVILLGDVSSNLSNYQKPTSRASFETILEEKTKG